MRGLFLATLLCAAALSAPHANAQTPQQVLALADGSLQQPGGAVQFYGAQALQTIAVQTANTGIYPQLLQLGPVTGATITGQTPLPLGYVVQGRVFHQGGAVDWLVGVSNVTRRIEYFQFVPVGFVPGPAPFPTPTTPNPGPVGNPPPGGGQPTGSGPSLPSGKDDGCQKYPGLC